MSGVTIREMRPEDHGLYRDFYAGLHSIHYENRPDIFKESVSVQPREVFCQELEKPDRRFLLAEKDGVPVGFCDLQLKIPPDLPECPIVYNRTLHINDLYVIPEARRQGVATALCSEAARIGRELRADKLVLTVWSFNQEAMGLYRKLGMTPMFTQMETKL